MKTLAESEQWREQAKQAVERFVRRFDESYRLLAYHAALPLVLTPELVNYLRNEFLRGEKVLWVAEVDLLLSDLCSQVGYELYAMDTHIRAYLLEEMEKHYGKQRMQEVAQVLISYVSYLSRSNLGRKRQELEAQRWAAMVYLGDDSCKKAAQEIAVRLLETSSGISAENLTESGIRAEIARLARITEELSPQLKEEQSLVDYARLVQRVLRTPDDVNLAEVHDSYQVGDVELTISNRLLPERLKYPEQPVTESGDSPQIQTFKFKVATITIGSARKTSSGIDLQPFEFKVATIEIKEPFEIAKEVIFVKTRHSLNDVEQNILTGALNKQTYKKIALSIGSDAKFVQSQGVKLWQLLSEALGTKVTKTNVNTVLTPVVIHRSQKQAFGFSENLGNGIELEMVAIPEGTFLMGSPEDEIGHRDSESAQHKVTIKAFFMGKYPVTQAQWKAIAALPQIKQELNPDPSAFKGDNRPVEWVSWYDAVEFCQRLSQYTGKPYRLPSEAEWEYACRAGTTTPFHFWETITTDLANYRGSVTYGVGVEGIYRKKTTSVGSFDVANAFGLYDMHGNVWEWCADHWHENYEGAPDDGSIWSSSDESSYRLLRGGSWYANPDSCRSACRNRDDAGLRFNGNGFRVVCAAAWT